MFSVSVIGDQDPFADLQQFARAYPALVLDEAQRSLVPRAERLLKQTLASMTPGKVKKPIQWTSEKQRRAFFATDGFGHGIPYKRTGGLMRSWEVYTTADENGFSLSIRNLNPSAPFVVGGWQQAFHATTGWPKARPVIDAMALVLQQAVLDIPGRVYEQFQTRGR